MHTAISTTIYIYIYIYICIECFLRLFQTDYLLLILQLSAKDRYFERNCNWYRDKIFIRTIFFEFFIYFSFYLFCYYFLHVAFCWELYLERKSTTIINILFKEYYRVYNTQTYNWNATKTQQGSLIIWSFYFWIGVYRHDHLEILCSI